MTRSDHYSPRNERAEAIEQGRGAGSVTGWTEYAREG
jgi:hypothetical protein